MHIEFVRTGGFMGLRLAVSLDTQQLSQEQASTVETMLHDSGFFELPEKLLPPSQSPDRFEYRVTVSAGDRSHSVVANEALIPTQLRPLLDYLSTLAMAAKRGNQSH